MYRGLASSFDSISVEQAEILSKLDEAMDQTILKSIQCTEDVKPFGGIPCINIAVCSVPMLAYIAHQSRYTIVSRSVAEQLRLIRDDHLTTSKKFVRSSDGTKATGFTFPLLEPFCVQLESVDVCIRNAGEVDPDPAPFCGIRLGQDFLVLLWFVPSICKWL